MNKKSLAVYVQLISLVIFSGLDIRGFCNVSYSTRKGNIPGTGYIKLLMANIQFRIISLDIKDGI